jgi:hypothetical protein
MAVLLALKYANRPLKGVNVFQIIGATSPMVVLHPKFVDEIKNNPDLSFEDSIKKAGYETGINP